MGHKKKQGKKLKSVVRRLIAAQRRDMYSTNWVNNSYNPRSQDVYDRKKRSSGAGFSKQ